jgi:ferrous iron transport protein A
MKMMHLPKREKSAEHRRAEDSLLIRCSIDAGVHSGLLSFLRKGEFMLPLSMASEGDKVMVARVRGAADTRKHLEDLGFVEGTQLSIVSAPGNGNVIVRLKDSRLAITSKMAEKVMVVMS